MESAQSYMEELENVRACPVDEIRLKRYQEIEVRRTAYGNVLQQYF